MGIVLTLALGASDEAPPQPGEVISYDELRRLRPLLPRELWPLRDDFFFEDMQLHVAPRGAYAPAPAYVEATRRFRDSRVGADGSLEDYVAGQPFPMEQIDCHGDPLAGVKIAWNFDHQWEGSGSQAHFRVTFVRRGDVQEGGFEGRVGTVRLSNRVEPYYLDGSGGSVFSGDPRKLVTQTDLTAPPGATR